MLRPRMKSRRCGLGRQPSRSHASLAARSIDFRALVENSLDLIFQVQVVGGEHRFTYATPSVFETLGWTVEELLTMSPADIYTHESLELIAEDVRILRASPDGRSTVMLEAVRKDGSRLWLENKVRLVSEEDDELSVIICSRDVTERRLLEDKLAQLAFLDGLTGVSNRRAFDQALTREWKRSLRETIPLSLVLVDVDKFKLFNDCYGHLVGDDCLRSIAAALRRTAKRPGDMVARYGGEEFAILLPATDLAGARGLANQLCCAVAKLKVPHARAACAQKIVTISCGAATASGQCCAVIKMPQGLVRAADSALYKAKRRGRNRVATALQASL